jgi:hypothetical protein
MIGQYLPNNNETATVAFRQKFCQLNNPLVYFVASLQSPNNDAVYIYAQFNYPWLYMLPDCCWSKLQSSVYTGEWVLQTPKRL